MEKEGRLFVPFYRKQITVGGLDVKAKWVCVWQHTVEAFTVKGVVSPSDSEGERGNEGGAGQHLTVSQTLPNRSGAKTQVLLRVS